MPSSGTCSLDWNVDSKKHHTLWLAARRKNGYHQYQPATNPLTYTSNLPTGYTGVIVTQLVWESATTFWIGFKANSMKWYQCLTLLKWPDFGTGRKSNTITFAKEHSSKLTSNDMMLYPLTSASLSPHQRSFLLPWMGISTEAYNWTMCRDQETLEHSFLVGCLHHSVSPTNPLRLRDLQGRGGGKSIRAKGDGWLLGNNVSHVQQD